MALDFAQVTDMDSSAALSFMKLAQEATEVPFFLLLTGFPGHAGTDSWGWIWKRDDQLHQVMP